MKYFIIKGYKGKKNDPLRMESSDGHLSFVAFGLKDLENSLKGLLPKGYRVPKAATLSRRIKQWGGLEMRSVFGIPMIEVELLDLKPLVYKTFEYHNKSRNSNFTLKVLK